jgi:glutamate 5-kinase
LLPVASSRPEGEFAGGDMVEIFSCATNYFQYVIARGISQYAASENCRIAGTHTRRNRNAARLQRHMAIRCASRDDLVAILIPRAIVGNAKIAA